MDDYGNELPWTTTVHGWHSQALYGYAPDGAGLSVLYEGVDFSELGA